MKTFLHRLMAELTLIFHIGIVIVLFAGGFFPQYQNLYLGTLLITLLSTIIFGYCIVSKWEFYFRRKINPKLNYDYAWTVHYIHKISNKYISPIFYERLAFSFLTLSIIIHLYFRFLY